MAINQILDKEGKFNFDKSQIGFCKLKLMTVECPAFATVYCIVLNYMQTHTHTHKGSSCIRIYTWSFNYFEMFSAWWNIWAAFHLFVLIAMRDKTPNEGGSISLERQNGSFPLLVLFSHPTLPFRLATGVEFTSRSLFSDNKLHANTQVLSATSPSSCPLPPLSWWDIIGQVYSRIVRVCWY